MLKIVICDDNIKDLMSTEKMLIRFQELYQQEQWEWEKFTDSNMLYNKVESGDLADIYILDMLMPVKSGIEIGRRIRDMGRDRVIIYTTTSDDFALDAYGVQAVRYLLKPLKEEYFYEAMEYAFAAVNTKDELLFPLKTQEGILSLPHSKIVYVENKDRTLHIHLEDGRVMKSLFIRTSFGDEIGNLSEDPSFLQVHKSFIVNLRYAEKLKQNGLEMRNEDTVPISKKRYMDVKRKYLSYMADKYR